MSQAHRSRRDPRRCPLRCEPLLRLWLLRMLVPLDAQREFLSTYGFRNDTLAEALGLHASARAENGGSRRAAQRKLAELHAAAERRRADCRVPPALAANCGRLRELMGIGDTDARILEFAVLLRTERWLEDTSDRLGKVSSVQVFRVLAAVLDLPEAEVRRSLVAGGVLATSGLVNVAKGEADSLRGKLSVLSDRFADQMLVETHDPVALLGGMVSPAPPPALGFDDFAHAERSLRILRPYLAQALDTHRAGVNLFVHGEPGMGKTELARLLARDAACALYEIASEDEDGDPMDGACRLRAFRAAQSFFARRRTLILFDETEDVFDDGGSFSRRKGTANARKAWMNRILEQAPVPTIWLSNSASCVDPAFIRRFDFVMELEAPPRRQRERIAAAACGEWATQEVLSRLAASEQAAPAVIARAAAVVQAVRHALPVDELPQAVERLVESTLRAQGRSALRRGDASGLPNFYDPCCVSADADLAAIADGIARSQSARLCLYGPPGTGKSAYARWLADRLDRPLAAHTVSDLVSPYVGMTERNIAKAFRDAEADQAVLLLDEVDGFLRDRRGAQRTWEVTEVNEMLTQLESYGGIFIASTNVVEGLDRAALRRFDLKVRFDYLAPEQAWRLFVRQCADLALGSPPLELRAALDRLRALTPGDFAAAAAQHRFRRIDTAQALLDVLAGECALKEDARRVAGFV